MTNQEILEKRKQLGLTQAELAKTLGVRRATITDWERGKHKPHPIFIKILKQLRNVSNNSDYHEVASQSYQTESVR